MRGLNRLSRVSLPQVPQEELPQYREREHLKGADAALIERVRAEFAAAHGAALAAAGVDAKAMLAEGRRGCYLLCYFGPSAHFSHMHACWPAADARGWAAVAAHACMLALSAHACPCCGRGRPGCCAAALHAWC